MIDPQTEAPPILPVNEYNNETVSIKITIPTLGPFCFLINDLAYEE